MQRDIIDRLSRLDHLIRIKGTGTPAQLAERLNLSERSIYDYINFMKGLGCPIKFDSYRESYFYEEEGFFVIAFFSKNKLKPLLENYNMELNE
ncbi:HTH domain-containing protein [Longitalea luteola]|uniref:HTH domain-containing protein n=1 Tax=Longitalea luteola TaxID=2812563 RepID=UPI001A97054C|nr:HTH domain-containing protein [Longitalea luteola]